MKETQFGLLIGSLVWLVCGLLASVSWVAHAGTASFAVPAAVGVCVLLEAVKLLTRRQGGWYRGIAALASLVTLLGIADTFWESITASEAHRNEATLAALHSSSEYRSMLGDQQALETQRKAVLARLEAVPEDWVTEFRRLNAEAREISSEATVLNARISAADTEAVGGQSASGNSVFSMLGRATGTSAGTIEFVVLMAIAGVLELSAWALTGRGVRSAGTGTRDDTIGLPALQHREPAEPKAAPTPKPSSEQTQSREGLCPTAAEYLRIAVDHRRAPYLLGRTIVAEKLGVTVATARALLEELVSGKQIVREGKFFREAN
jgi:hypothetical protein